MKGVNANTWWLLLVGVISLLLCAPFFRALYGMGDEGIFLRGAELMLRGKKLYVDFFAFLPPGSYALTAAWFDIVGISIGAARTMAVMTIVGIACFTFLACQRASKSAPLSAALTIGWVMLSQWHWMQVSHHWFTTFFSVVTVWAALASLEQTEPRVLRWPLIAGLAAGAATMVTQSRGTLIALASMTAFFKLRQSRSELIAYVSGGMLVFVGVIVFLIGQHTLVAAFDVIGFTATRYASIQPVPYAYGASIFDWPLKYVFPLAALLSLSVIARDWNTSIHDRRLRLCAAFALAGFLGCFPRPDIAHIGFAIPLTLPLLALCATELTRQLRPVTRCAIAFAALIGLGVPSAVALAAIARTALDGQTMSTARGKVVFPFKEGVSELFQKIAATPPQDTFFFYPYMPMMPFLVAREHVSKYDIFIPGYTTPEQYQDACRSVIRYATWVVIDRRLASPDYWKQTFPAMPAAKPQETIRFEQALDRAFAPTAIKDGFFDLRHRRRDINDDICKGIAEGAY